MRGTLKLAAAAMKCVVATCRQRPATSERGLRSGAVAERVMRERRSACAAADRGMRSRLFEICGGVQGERHSCVLHHGEPALGQQVEAQAGDHQYDRPRIEVAACALPHRQSGGCRQLA